jgi:stearoyl-CoA desaturase (delta-9 desaturase)
MITPYRQTQLVIWVNQILFFGLIIFSPNIWMIPLGIAALYAFGCMSEVSLHRYFTHKSYETSEIKQKILRVFAFLTAQGPTISWVTVHRTHHAFEDTDKDPHSPYHLKWWEIYLAFLPNNYKKNLVIDLIKSRHWNYFVFENKWYFVMWCGLWAASLLTSFYLFYFIVAGTALWYIATCIVNIASHRYVGEKQFDKDVGFNSRFINLITGVGHHNNHHHAPQNYTYSTGKEIDIYAWVIRRFFLIKN